MVQWGKLLGVSNDREQHGLRDEMRRRKLQQLPVRRRIWLAYVPL